MLTAVIEKDGLGREPLLRVLESARGFSSDGDKTGFIPEVVAMNLKDLSVTNAGREAAAGIVVTQIGIFT